LDVDPIYLGSSPKYRYSDIIAWVERCVGKGQSTDKILPEVNEAEAEECPFDLSDAVPVKAVPSPAEKKRKQNHL